MRILLDSHVFVWFVIGSRRCPASIHDLVSRSDVRAYVSAATAWELATKFRIGKWPEAGSIVTNLRHVLTTLRFEPLPVTLEHGRVAGLFDSAHKDPFDRMLAAQSQIEAMPLVTVDPKFATFGIETIS
jgi:PIN domain nuclease of toxin-antitoxin system